MLFRRIVWTSLILLLLLTLGSLSLFLPRTSKVHITGTEVKRQDAKLNANEGTSRDIRYIYAVDKNNEPLVFRNEDTGWSWPPYFKFDSGDISSEAMNLAQKTPKPTVLVTSYGLRVRVLSLYPNVVAMRVVSPDYQHIPVFNIIFFVIFFAIVFVIWRAFRRALNWMSRKAEPDPHASPTDI